MDLKYVALHQAFTLCIIDILLLLLLLLVSCFFIVSFPSQSVQQLQYESLETERSASIKRKKNAHRTIKQIRTKTGEQGINYNCCATYMLCVNKNPIGSLIDNIDRIYSNE